MIRTTLALATAGLFLAACDAKPAPEAAKPAETAAAPAGPNADSAAAAKAMTDMAAAMSASGANAEIKNPQMKAFVDSYDQMVNVVLTVKDEASANAIGPQLKPIMAQLEAQSKALDALPESEKAGASMQGMARIMGATTKMAQHISSLPPEVQKTLDEELKALPPPK
ncbi:MAG TPA: hypothetical protein VGO52_07540 [Hyphomonadaceae bacterium]|jgi:hypothetical protein|nr:hypothetical protein [Hyphomonadaceae bacterium]